MKRIIHPIGQGAFYSEQFDNFTIVYDCGKWKKSKSAQQFVEKSFSSISTIDILFISHFDFDHVSLIPTLKQNRNIKTCVLPVINNIEKIILSNIYMDKNEKELATLVMDPKSFFGTGTKIIYVDLDDSQSSVTKDPILNNKSIDDYNDGEHIASGTELKFPETDWIYVPYNIEHKERHDKVIRLLQKHNLKEDELKADSNNYIENNIKEIRKVYRALPGGINSNSMYLYSGPMKELSGYIDTIEFYYKTLRNSEYRIACVYTGDGNLDIVRRTYKKYWNNVGTIQLPHHGSEKNYDYNLLNMSKEKYLFFASFGNNNTYGHPSKEVIMHINENESVFFPVSETVATEFVEIILC